MSTQRSPASGATNASIAAVLQLAGGAGRAGPPAEAAQARSSTPRPRARRPQSTRDAVQAEVLHRARVRDRARAGRSHHPEGRALRQRDRRRRAGVHGLHDGRSAAAAGRDARRPRLDRSRVPGPRRQAVRDQHRRPADGAPRRHRVADRSRTRASCRTASRSSRSFRDLTASGFWTTKIGIADLAVPGEHVVAEWNGCPDGGAEEARPDAAGMTNDGMRATRTFLASFLVLFLEIALIRWMPAYIRLLSYFSNFILLASFLGIGLGCLLAPARARLFNWFPLVQAIVIAAVYFFRLEVAVPTAGSIYFSSGTAAKVVAGRKHDAAAAAVRDRRGAVRHAGAAHGARDGAAAAAPGLHDQPRRQPRRRRRRLA